MPGKIETLGDDNNLLQYLQGGDLTSEREEVIVTQVRADLLKHVSAGGDVSLEIMSALASFCHGCEHVLDETPAETEIVERLRAETSDLHKLTIACYRPILAENLPLAEIETIRPLLNETAMAVQAQYEQNPYPRWRTLPRPQVFDTIKKCLSAGCGTGREVLIDAAMSPRSSFTAIDISRVSLAYALMSSRKFGVENVRFVQGDLRDVKLIGEEYDYIKSIGVLHHMDRPAEGLRALKSVLKQDGTMKIAVYSARARAMVLEAIRLRNELNIPATPDGIRAFRQILFRLPPEHPAKRTVNSQDFYSMSGTRDLIFHVQEHNFSIRQIADLIEDAGLRIKQFGAASYQEQRFRALGYTDLADVKAWEKAEDEDPSIFASSMYSILLAH